MAPSLPRRSVVEGVGTALLLACVVGSGILADRLTSGQGGLTLLVNSLATGAGLTALILGFGSFSGAQFNPAVTLVDAIRGGRPWRELPPYAAAQTVGAFAGVAAAHAMFGEPIFAMSHKPRSGVAQVFAEFVATFGLLAILFVGSRRGAAAAVAVGAYIMAAYWFTSSTSFANPVVTLARSATDTFTGIRPADVPGFLAGQGLATAAFVLLLRWLRPSGSSPQSELSRSER